MVIAASHAGQPHNPSWYYNLKAHPEVTIAGIPARATVVDDPVEQERLWGLADKVFPAFTEFRRRAAQSDRVVPVITLDLETAAG